MVPVKLTIHRRALAYFMLPMYLWALVLVLIVYFVAVQLNTTHQDTTLIKMSHLLSQVVPDSFANQESSPNAITAFYKSIEKDYDLSLTLADEGGKVLYSNEAWPLDNILDKPDVISTRQGQAISTIETSEINHNRYLFRTAEVKFAGTHKVLLRTGINISQTFEPFEDLLRYIAIAVLMMLLLMHTLIALASFYLRRTLVRLREPLGAYVHGNFAASLVESSRLSIEISKLERTVVKLGNSLQKRFTGSNAVQLGISNIFSELDEGVIIVDQNSDVININSCAANLFHIKPEYVVGKKLQEGLRNADLLDLVSLTFVTKKTLSKNITLFERDKTYLHVQAALLQDRSSQLFGLVLFIRNITEAVRLEQARKEFVANVSHELRTPIATIQGYIETLRDKSLSDQNLRESFLEKAHHASMRLGSIVDGMLMLSNLEGHHERSEFLDISSLSSLVEDTVSSLKGLAAKKQIELKLTSTKDIKAAMHRNLLSHAIHNLLENALKYSPEKSTIEIEIFQDNSTTTVSVTDHGIGIDAKHLPKLFMRFYRVDEGRARHEGGSGLGLAIVKHIALLHGGSVEVRSEKGRGSCFKLSLPITIS